MTNTQEVKIKREFTIKFDGTMEQYIEIANALSPNGLDSLDAGDATGAWIEIATLELAQTEEGHFIYREDDFLLTMEYDDNLFIWSPELPR